MINIKIEKIKARIEHYKTLRFANSDFAIKSFYSDRESGLEEALIILEEVELGKTRPIDNSDHIMTVSEFEDEKDCRVIISSDGHGYYVKDDLVYVDTCVFSESGEGFTHVAWYNK